jgi:hypothetical protein
MTSRPQAAAALHEADEHAQADLRDPAMMRALNSVIVGLSAAPDEFRKLGIIRDGVKLVASYNDPYAIDRISEVAINEHGINPDLVQQMMSSGMRAYSERADREGGLRIGDLAIGSVRPLSAAEVRKLAAPSVGHRKR